MQAEIGDKLNVTGHRPGDEDRHGEIIEIQGDDGSPPYVVRWEDGTESVVFLRDETLGSGGRQVTHVITNGDY
jgi:Domain of unknown function (DUF1918)